MNMSPVPFDGDDLADLCEMSVPTSRDYAEEWRILLDLADDPDFDLAEFFALEDYVMEVLFL